VGCDYIVWSVVEVFAFDDNVYCAYSDSFYDWRTVAGFGVQLM